MMHKALLAAGAKEMGIALSEVQITRLLDYLRLIIKWNKTYNLSAIRTVEEGVKKHLLDSLSIMPFIKETPLLDVGAGAGLPGIVIAIMRPEVVVTVLDAAGKKCRFMQFAKTQLGLQNLTVVNKRVEDFQSKQCFEQITARAFAEVRKILELTQHLLCDDGCYLLMKGANFKQECLPKETKVEQLSIPGVSDRRFLLKIRSKK
ncbi:16S rRNA (guanine(527)-N(7))-methyltransferase RsmG [Bathymodiolus septemdierum thioautotrophic gill symbiont]|uniref:Ribosomal RNA small subunit methyltransferase G n=1 Tax=endosymbiont of Bathymodiolus septemdierum str. Myojin knoll TaxID=1303921 RepID=A0A0P0UQ68_9GAMM|nr:16S rRNA (guanine527-N7)-methyltransferase [endosymbiont of Bathymodiolus septemdierum str. Myojin knoll]